MMAKANPLKPRCPNGCETFLGNSSTGHVFCADCGRPPKTIDPADELGKVWDVLHAAGINGAGWMSASEGVKELAQKVPNNVELMDAYQAVQDELLKLKTIIANDAYAATFQSMGQYRKALGEL